MLKYFLKNYKNFKKQLLKNPIENSGEIGKFNLGAFLFNYLWLFINKCYLPLVFFVLIHLIGLTFVDNIYFQSEHPNCSTTYCYGIPNVLYIPYKPYIGDIPLYSYIIISLVIGFRGNSWAWKKFNSKNLFLFQTKQKKLTKYALTTLAIVLSILIIGSFIFMYSVGPMF